MCGRYVIEWLPDEVHEMFQLRRIPEGLFRSYNAAPTQQLPVIVDRGDEGRDLTMMRWGLVPRWAKPGESKGPVPFNARAETLLEKPMFRSLVARRRCLVPANSYYEWKQAGKGKQPYLFSLPDRPLFAFAGLYDEVAGPDGEVSGSYTIITTDANDLTREFHHRMPVILHRADEELWASPDVDDPQAVQHLLRPYDPDEMTLYAVSPAVNNVRVNEPSLIEPITIGAPAATEPDEAGGEADDAPPGQHRLF